MTETTTPKTTCPLCRGTRVREHGRECPECRGTGLVVNHFALAGPGRSETAEEEAAAEGRPLSEVRAERDSIRKNREGFERAVGRGFGGSYGEWKALTDTEQAAYAP